MASLNKRTTAPPPHQNQQSTSQIQLVHAKKEDPLALAACRVPPARWFCQRVLPMLQRKRNKRWDCSGRTNNQAITEELGLMTRKDSPQSPWCSGSKQSSCPLTAACSRRGGKKQQQQKKSNQQSRSVFVLKFEITFCSKCTKKEFEWDCCY